MTGSSLAEIEQSPFIESLLAKGYEILYFTDPLDETFVQTIPGYNGKQFVNIAKDDLAITDDDTMEQTRELESYYKPLMEWLISTLDEHIDKAVISNRLTTSPFAIIAASSGLSGHAQRILDEQGVTHKNPNMAEKDTRNQSAPPSYQSLLEYVERDRITEEIKNLIQLMFETTAIRSGYPVKDITQFAGRVEGLIRKAVGVSIEEEARVNVIKAQDKTDEEKKVDEEFKKSNIIYDEEEDYQHDEL